MTEIFESFNDKWNHSPGRIKFKPKKSRDFKVFETNLIFDVRKCLLSSVASCHHVMLFSNVIFIY